MYLLINCPSQSVTFSLFAKCRNYQVYAELNLTLNINFNFFFLLFLYFGFYVQFQQCQSYNDLLNTFNEPFLYQISISLTCISCFNLHTNRSINLYFYVHLSTSLIFCDLFYFPYSNPFKVQPCRGPMLTSNIEDSSRNLQPTDIWFNRVTANGYRVQLIYKKVYIR